jgi:hypothetical protein
MRFSLASIAALLLAVGLASAAAARDGGWDAVVAAAKKEGAVTLYTSATAPQHGQLAKAFESK